MVLKTRKGKATAGAAATSAIALAVSIAAPQEGYVPYVYRDAVGVLTYCYGETQNAAAQKGKTFSEAECKALLIKRMAHYDQGNAACVSNWDGLPVETKAAFDSFSYNLGNGAFCRSKARAYLEQGNIRAACDSMMSYVHAGGRVLSGLVKRRKLEREVCLKGA